MGISEDTVREMVQRAVGKLLGPSRTDAPTPEARSTPGKRFIIGEAEVAAVPRGGRLPVQANAVITPLAVDTARDRRVELVREPATGAGLVTAAPIQAQAAPLGAKTVALGADHGGYALKEELNAYLGELGYGVIDCGTHSTEAVDYPDLAYAVARLVADGRAWRGIVVDGAGIGSCMAANKVPGIRAALCTDHATAVNSREHNDANVLTLGGTMIGANLARQIVKVWLETPFGGGRHARRVDKIRAIEQRFLKV